MDLNKYIDYTNLNAFTTKKEIELLCQEAKEYSFASVCINPVNVKYASNFLKNSNVLVCTVIGFPLGQNTTDIKIAEIKNAINSGADELDMVINIGKLKEMDYEYIENELTMARKSSLGKTLKIIIETCYLTKDEIIKMIKICNDTQMDFIKTSTGFGTKGAQLEDVILMNEFKSDHLQIKASGGIRTKTDAEAFIKAGATRLGMSKIADIVK